jgi:hypothetical protein
MKKLLIVALFLSFGFSAFALTFDAGGGTINAYSSLRLFWRYQNIDIDYDAPGARDYNRGSPPVGAQGNSRISFTFAKDNYGAQPPFLKFLDYTPEIVIVHCKQYLLRSGIELVRIFFFPPNPCKRINPTKI